MGCRIKCRLGIVAVNLLARRPAYAFVERLAGSCCFVLSTHLAMGWEPAWPGVVRRAVDGNQHFGTADAKPSVTIYHTADHKAPVLDNRLVDI